MIIPFKTVGAALVLCLLSVPVADDARGESGRKVAPVVLEVRREADPAKRGGVFPDLAAAIGSIADASAERPYLVKVLPGIHGVPARGIEMKPFVDVEGSGPGETVLEGAVPAGTSLWTHPLGADQPAVVRMARDSRLRRLTVRNTSREGGIALYFPMTANAGAEEVTAEAIGAMGTEAQFDYHAIRVEGPGADVTLDRVTARYRMEVPPGALPAGDNVAIGVFSAGKLRVSNSRAVAENGWWNVGIASQGGSESVVRDSVIEVGGLAEGAFAYSAEGARDEAVGTRMIVTCPPTGGWGCAAIYACAGSQVGIRESDLQVIPGTRADGVSLLRGRGAITASRLAGPAGFEDWQIAECRDADSRPIPPKP